MAKKTYTVKTFTQTAQPRAARLRGVTAAVGRSSAVVSGSGADHSHPNQRFLETLGDDIAATEDGGAATRRINLSADGSAYIEYNPDTGCLMCNVPMASRGDVAAFNGEKSPTEARAAAAATTTVWTHGRITTAPKPGTYSRRCLAST